MNQALKELIVVLLLTVPVWVMARRLYVPLMPADVFDRRRNVWLALTVAGFLAPSFWLYALVAAPLMIWAGRRDPNPAGFYLLIFYAVPNAAVPIPPVLVNQLFDLSHLRLLSLVLLVPAAWHLVRRQRSGIRQGMDAMDLMLLAMATLMIVLFVPFESATNSLRRLFLLCIDTLVLYYVFSRACRSPAAIRDCLWAWVLAGMLLAAVAIFESARSWLVYVPIADRWGVPNSFAWLLRGDRLRAQASTGHALALGYWLAIAWGFFLLVHRAWPQRWARYAVGALLLGGLAASLSRGPWLTAALMTVLFLLLNPKGIGPAVKAIAGLVVVCALVLLSPLGSRIIDYLPFIGTVDSGNVDYRQQLFDMAWPLILQNPWGGNPDVMLNLESLRQGQGIIDLVNGYIFVALFYGLGALALFVGFMSVSVLRALSVWAQCKRADIEWAYVAAALASAVLSTMFYIATAGIDHTAYLLAGMCAGCWSHLRDAPARADRAVHASSFEPLTARPL